MRVPTSVLDECGESFLAADKKRQKASTQLYSDTAYALFFVCHFSDLQGGPMVVITYKRCSLPEPFPISSVSPSCIADGSPIVNTPPATQHRNAIWRAL
jgi:hypothetical protein